MYLDQIEKKSIPKSVMFYAKYVTILCLYRFAESGTEFRHDK